MNYEVTCWFCGKPTMQPAGSYHQCSECGTTWNDQPKLGSYLDIATDHEGQSGSKKYHPVMRSGKAKLPPTPQELKARRKARQAGQKI